MDAFDFSQHLEREVPVLLACRVPDEESAATLLFLLSRPPPPPPRVFGRSLTMAGGVIVSVLVAGGVISSAFGLL